MCLDGNYDFREYIGRPKTATVRKSSKSHFFCFQSVTFFKLKMRFNLVPCRNKKFLFRQLVTRVLIVISQNYLRKGPNVKNANSIIIALAILNVHDK